MYAKLSILGMYNYDPTIFDNLALPEGIDRDTLLQQILFDNAGLSLYITEPETLRTAIGFWSRSQSINWERLARALTEDYNPLHNYDRHEEWDDNGRETETGNSSSQSAGNNKLSKAGYNEDAGLADAEQTEAGSSGSAETKRDSNRQDKHTGHIYGNIGVTTAAQMIAGEIDIRTRHNIYQTISDDFKQKFCIMVY